MIGLKLYLLQRISAALLAMLVMGHIGMILYAMQAGYTSQDILSRTQGSIFWFLYYALFVLAASVHGSIGLRVIASEWLNIPRFCLSTFTALAGVGFFYLGIRAVIAVTLP